MSLPTKVADSETVVRVIKSPWHLDKSKRSLTRVAFQPPAGRDDLSVIRQEMGDDYCAAKGREIAGPNYKGLATGLVGYIRKQEAEVVSSADGNYEGHADIVSLATEPPQDDPHPPEVMKRLVDYYDAMVAHFIYYRDTDRESETWAGPPLARTA